MWVFVVCFCVSGPSLIFMVLASVQGLFVVFSNLCVVCKALSMKLYVKLRGGFHRK